MCSPQGLQHVAHALQCYQNEVRDRFYDDVTKWKHFPRYWPFVRGIHRSHVNSPHKGQRRGTLIFSLICACINGWVNNRKAGDLRRHRIHYYLTVMSGGCLLIFNSIETLPCCDSFIGHPFAKKFTHVRKAQLWRSFFGIEAREKIKFFWLCFSTQQDTQT